MHWMATVKIKMIHILCRSIIIPKQFTHHLLLLTVLWQVVLVVTLEIDTIVMDQEKHKIDFFYCSNVRGLQIISQFSSIYNLI